MTLYIKIRICDEHSGVIYKAENTGKETDIANTICKALNFIRKKGGGETAGWKMVDWIKKDFFALEQALEEDFMKK